MSKFHINPKTGNPGICKAKVTCPYGDLEKDHFETKEEARVAFEKQAKDSALDAWQKRVNPKAVDAAAAYRVGKESMDRRRTERQENFIKYGSSYGHGGHGSR